MGMRKERQVSELRPAIVTPEPKFNECRRARFGVRKRTMALHLQSPHRGLAHLQMPLKAQTKIKMSV